MKADDTEHPCEQSNLRIVRLQHAQLTIPTGAEEIARRFYCGILGLVEIPQPAALAGAGGFWGRFGDLEIHVGTEDGVDRMATKAHLAYEVTNLSAWRSHLEAHDSVILDGLQFPGFYRFEIRDPFGHRIEFIQPHHHE